MYYRDCCFDQVVNALCNVHPYIGVGSVFSLLKTLGWAIELYAGNGMACEVVDEDKHKLSVLSVWVFLCMYVCM